MYAIQHVRHGWLTALLTALLCLPVLAVAGAPTDTLRGTIDQVLAVLHDARLDSAGKRERIRALVDTRFDYQLMSQSTLGENWKHASPAQQQRFVDLYARMMQDTYLVLVEEYRDEAVVYEEERIRMERKAKVDTLILNADRQTPVCYKLRLKDGDWLVYDVIIDGISLISSYRSSYQQIVRTDGLDGLLARITTRLDRPTE